jgi:hypothetical protein
MSGAQVQPASIDEVRAEIEALRGVRRVVLDGPPWRMLLVCEAGAEGLRAERAARAALRRAGGDPGRVELEVGFLAPPPATGRVRFERLDLQRPRAGVAAATAELEWEGKIVAARVEGEGGPAGELRLCASATLRALEAVLDGELSFELIGAKALRVFDHEAVAVLARSPELPGRTLVGVVLAPGDPGEAAALAVLDATNRLLGTYLRGGG